MLKPNLQRIRSGGGGVGFQKSKLLGEKFGFGILKFRLNF